MAGRMFLGSGSLLTRLFWYLLARLRGSRTLDETGGDNTDLSEFNSIMARYPSEYWRRLQRKYPKLRAINDRVSLARPASAEFRTDVRDFVRWFHDHEPQLR